MQRVSRRAMLARSGRILTGGVASAVLGGLPANSGSTNAPNIILIVADDLGYGDLGCYGQPDIQTPNLDRMAAEGLRFTQSYAGCAICTPSRASLMTGLHTGHTRVQNNDFNALAQGDITVASLLRSASYATWGIGKWGLGGPQHEGAPYRQGFDVWFGYLGSAHAHNYYPSTLFLNGWPLPIRGNKGPVSQRTTYSHDLFADLALRRIAMPQDRPLFLYLPFTIPHANTFGSYMGMDGLPLPSDAPYSNERWPEAQRHYAAMITRLDRDVGRILDLLDATGLSDNTLVIFTSDNGPHSEGGADPSFFNSTAGLRGKKRDMYEGGIRVPLIARWPGAVREGETSDLVCAAWDLLPTFAELAGVGLPDPIDGISIVPELLGADRARRSQLHHDYLYWEFRNGQFLQAARMDDWKAVAFPFLRAFELYDLSVDPGETTNVASAHPAVASQLQSIMAIATSQSAHVELPHKRQTQIPFAIWRFKRP